MAPTEEEWADMANKYGYGIEAAKAIPLELIEFVQTMIYLHETQDLTDNSLWIVVQEQFEGFTTDDFRRIRTVVRTKLRIYLLKRGVFAATNTRQYSISEALFDLLHEEQQHEWTDDELVEALKIAKPIVTVALQDRLNPTMTRLLYQESEQQSEV
jgi:hypothetical protein